MSGFTPNPQSAVLNWMSSNAFVQVNKSLLRKIGDRNTILLSETIRQFNRWFPNKLQADGSFYWTQVNCEIETGYSRSTQQRGFKALEELKVLKSRASKIVENGIEKQVRFITLDFDAIEKLMFEDDSHLIKEIEAKYETKKQKNKESRQRAKEAEKKAKETGIQNESSLEPQGIVHAGIQNESSVGFKVNPRGDSKRVVSKKESLIKNNKSLKNNSITQREISAIDLPFELKVCISDWIERLNDNNISALQIFDLYKSYQGVEHATDSLFLKEFRKVVKDHAVITDFDALLTTYMTNAIAKRTPKASTYKQSTRKEVMSDEMRKHQEESDKRAAQKPISVTVPDYKPKTKTVGDLIAQMNDPYGRELLTEEEIEQLKFMDEWKEDVTA